MKVEVYWNLRKHSYSIRHKGKVIAHLSCITLKDVQWVVQPAGRKRVLRERRKNVHAFARGTWIYGNDELDLTNNEPRLTKRQPIKYNPYRNKSFVACNAPDIQVQRSDYARLGSTFSVTHESYKPTAYIYNFLEPTYGDDPDFNRYDQGPRI
tara:strand:+ start:483 stop:941 length:459 start_codon:yes stop_codon:yes gene_type:complete